MQRIFKRLVERKFTQQEIADVWGITQSRVSAILKGN